MGRGAEGDMEACAPTIAYLPYEPFAKAVPLFTAQRLGVTQHRMTAEACPLAQYPDVLGCELPRKVAIPIEPAQANSKSCSLQV